MAFSVTVWGNHHGRMTKWQGEVFLRRFIDRFFWNKTKNIRFCQFVIFCQKFKFRSSDQRKNFWDRGERHFCYPFFKLSLSPLQKGRFGGLKSYLLINPPGRNPTPGFFGQASSGHPRLPHTSGGWTHSCPVQVSEWSTIAPGSTLFQRPLHCHWDLLP